MKKSDRYCFLAFGELALDVTYDERFIITRESGGVSAFNTLYNLSMFGEEAYAVGGVGTDLNAIKSIESLKKSYANVDNIQFIQKPTNVFYIFKPQSISGDDAVEINRKSPISDKKSVEWSNKLCTELPPEFIGRNIILIVSNFEEVTGEFIQNTKRDSNNCIVSLDITNPIIFDRFSKDYLWEYLKNIDLLQCNEKTFKAVCKRLDVKDGNELFEKLNLQIFTLTRGSNGATFYYRDDDNKVHRIDKKPEVVASMVDPTGAGDAFHAMLLVAYHRKILNNAKLNKTYFDSTFKIANALARKVVQIEGARGEQKELLEFMLGEFKDKEEEIRL